MTKKLSNQDLLVILSGITSDTVGKLQRGQYVINAIEEYSRRLHQEGQRPDNEWPQEWLDCASRCLAAIGKARS